MNAYQHVRARCDHYGRRRLDGTHTKFSRRINQQQLIVFSLIQQNNKQYFHNKSTIQSWFLDERLRKTYTLFSQQCYCRWRATHCWSRGFVSFKINFVAMQVRTVLYQSPTHVDDRRVSYRRTGVWNQHLGMQRPASKAPDVGGRRFYFLSHAQNVPPPPPPWTPTRTTPVHEQRPWILCTSAADRDPLSSRCRWSCCCRWFCSVETTAMDHAIITVDADVVGLTERRFHAASYLVSNAPSVDCTLGASLIAWTSEHAMAKIFSKFRLIIINIKNINQI